MTEFDSERLIIRPVVPSDAPGLIEAVDLCSAEDVRMRFCGGMSHLSPEFAMWLSQVGEARELGLIAEDGAGHVLGAARLTPDRHGEAAEFSILVRSDRQKHGLGTRLLTALLDHAVTHGVDEVWGDVACDNAPMLELAEELGFRREASEDPRRFRLVWTPPPR